MKLLERWRNRRTWPHCMDGTPVPGVAREGGTGVWDVQSECVTGGKASFIQRHDPTPVADPLPSCVVCAASYPSWSTYEVERTINHCIAHGAHMPCGQCETMRMRALLAQQAPPKDPRVEAMEIAAAPYTPPWPWWADWRDRVRVARPVGGV